MGRVLDILSYRESTVGPTMVGTGEQIFNVRVFRSLENAVLILDFAHTINILPLTIRFQLSCKHYLAFSSSKLPDCDYVLTQVHLNFFKFQKLRGVTSSGRYISDFYLQRFKELLLRP